MNGLDKAVQAIRRSRTIAVAGHANPDGDSIGSTLSLGLGLKSIGKRVHMISRDGVPHRYRKLPGARSIVTRAPGPVDLAIAVDCCSIEMLGGSFEPFSTAAEILEIDHHDFRRSFGTIALIDKRAAAVGEIIFLLLHSLGAKITKPVAQNLMTSIVVETSSFRLPNTRPFTFKVCSELIQSGVDYYKLVDAVFWSRRRSAALLSGIALSRCRFLKGGRLVWSIVGTDDYKAAGGRMDDVDPVPDDMRSIDSVKVAVLFRETEQGMLRVSLRSKSKLNVARIAEQYHGGGHFDVAGCTIPNDPKAIQELLAKAGRLIGR